MASGEPLDLDAPAQTPADAGSSSRSVENPTCPGCGHARHEPGDCATFYDSQPAKCMCDRDSSTANVRRIAADLRRWGVSEDGVAPILAWADQIDALAIGDSGDERPATTAPGNGGSGVHP